LFLSESNYGPSAHSRRHSQADGDVCGLSFSPSDNLIAFTTLEGGFVRWTSPIPSSHPDPVSTEAVTAKKLDKLLDDEFGEDVDDDMEDKGEDVDDLFGEGGDDWIVDDDGGYGAEDGEKTRGGRTEVGRFLLFLNGSPLTVQST